MTTLKRWEPKPGTHAEAVHNALIDFLIRVVVAQETRRREREATTDREGRVNAGQHHARPRKPTRPSP